MDFDREPHDGTAAGVGSQDDGAIAVLDTAPRTGFAQDDASDTDGEGASAAVALDSPVQFVEPTSTDGRDRPRRKKERRDGQSEVDPASPVIQDDAAPAQNAVGDKPVVSTQAPHTLGTGDEWPTNRVLLRGRIEQPKRKPLWIKGLASGASYQQRSLMVVEPGLDDDFADLAPKKRISLLIPEGLPYAQMQMLAMGEGKEPREGRLVSIMGRMVQEKVRDPRYERESNFGGEIVTRLYVKVLEVRLIDEDAAAEVALIRVNGEVEEVQRINGPLNGSKFAAGTAQSYHQVTMVTCEKFARPEPGAAPREVKTRVKVFVPSDIAGAEMLLVPGNHAQVEAEYVLTTAYLPKGHALLDQVDPEKLDWLRSRPSDHLVVTHIIPAHDAKPLEGEARIAARLLAKRPAGRRKRKPRPQQTQAAA